jgi:hypothetical protein
MPIQSPPLRLRGLHRALPPAMPHAVSSPRTRLTPPFTPAQVPVPSRPRQSTVDSSREAPALPPRASAATPRAAPSPWAHAPRALDQTLEPSAVAPHQPVRPSVAVDHTLLQQVTPSTVLAGHALKPARDLYFIFLFSEYIQILASSQMCTSLI